MEFQKWPHKREFILDHSTEKTIMSEADIRYRILPTRKECSMNGLLEKARRNEVSHVRGALLVVIF